jgi:hypothetical protein
LLRAHFGRGGGRTTARRKTPSHRCLNREVSAPAIGARRANRRFSHSKSALDRIVETDLVGNGAHYLRLPRDRRAANIIWPAHATKRYLSQSVAMPSLRARRPGLPDRCHIDQARPTVQRDTEAPMRARPIAALVHPSVCNVVQHRDVAAIPMVFKIVTSRISIIIRLTVPENSLIGAKNSFGRPSNEFRL